MAYPTIGDGSFKKRKDKMEEAVDKRGLFRDLMHNVWEEVGTLALTLQQEMKAVGEELVRGVGQTMDLVRGDAVEVDRDPELQERVGEEVDEVRREIVRLGELVR
jgi:hypothetical protein